ncbi:pyridoxal-phosphate dependent enzyme [Streptomyces sp. TRM66268-LWL]|uniref:Pyridoxal-phosphate dependent enzyme n=1 Tax=Streptomyces polyasparticus TaxID=2767826 RepID=A0ABR7SD30_9ACTN|nr:pyridoxal-phosphate dependent enzyme [Streptomyces polyasparticus]MBC9712645.1 pyridoxal-phosphate dependent enzyme [Streptomyces polyasparticus]
MSDTASLAQAQRSLADPDIRYPLWPPLIRGCPRTSSADMSYPVDVEYDYAQVPADFLTRAGSGLDRWSALLPPLLAPSLGEGGTPLVDLGEGVYLKDESRNPTWSHKDRLNRCTVSAALGAGAPGIVVASSGNHGASAAAYAARAGLRCVVLGSAGLPPAVASFLSAYGAVVLPVPAEERWPLTERIVEEFGYFPVSNLTPFHTGSSFGPEGYKTVAYEIVAELGVPGAVFVPTGYGELLFGIGKGFAELRELGLTDRVPRLYSCEPRTGGPLAAAVRQGVPATRVPVGATDAYGIDCPVNSYRGVLALERSGGDPLLVDDAQLKAAQSELAAQGLWCELSAAAGLAGLRAAAPEVEGPVVCVATSSGFKDVGVGGHGLAPVDPAWESVLGRLSAAGIRPA